MFHMLYSFSETVTWNWLALAPWVYVSYMYPLSVISFLSRQNLGKIDFWRFWKSWEENSHQICDTACSYSIAMSTLAYTKQDFTSQWWGRWLWKLRRAVLFARWGAKQGLGDQLGDLLLLTPRPVCHPPSMPPPKPSHNHPNSQCKMFLAQNRLIKVYSIWG